jgi:hypothetical protein
MKNQLLIIRIKQNIILFVHITSLYFIDHTISKHKIIILFLSKISYTIYTLFIKRVDQQICKIGKNITTVYFVFQLNYLVIIII